jgi:histidine triad (HIT) family protein
MPDYDPNNIFAKILRGEIPCHKVHEDEDALAFMDIMPRAPGHSLVIPKSPARNILDIDQAALSKLILSVQRLAKASKSAFAADGITLMQFSESAGGQVVFHLHFHVLPRHNGITLLAPHTNMEANEMLAANAAKLRAALGKMHV